MIRWRRYRLLLMALLGMCAMSTISFSHNSSDPHKPEAQAKERREAPSLALQACVAVNCPPDEPSNDESHIRAKLDALLPCFSKQPPADFAQLFSESFLKAISGDQIKAVFQDVVAKHGSAVEAKVARMSGPFAAEVQFLLADDTSLSARIQLEETPPYRITAFVLLGTTPANDTLEAVVSEMKALPGRASFCLMQLGDEPKPIWQHNADEPLAVASSFKLLIFATLVSEIADGRVDWSHVLRVRRDWASLPSGQVQDWPADSPVTLHTLATLMISQSDNTAADHLFRLLGRKRIEQLQCKVGVKQPELNQPMLCTGELFKIKLALTQAQQQAYIDGDGQERRKQLESVVENATLSGVRPPTAPVLVDKVEWFFSAADMCRILAWLHRHRETPQVFDILSINRGLPVDESEWPFVGFKEGAEVGVLNYTLLLRDKGGAWFAFSITWNDPEREVNAIRLMGLAHRLLRLHVGVAAIPKKALLQSEWVSYFP